LTIFVALVQLPNTNGAAKITVGTDLKTEILCGIKLEIAQPTLSSASAASQGRLAVSVTLSPAVSKDYSNHEANELTTSCEKLLERVLRGCVDLQELVIIENKACWMLCIDVVVRRVHFKVHQVSAHLNLYYSISGDESRWSIAGRNFNGCASRTDKHFVRPNSEFYQFG
jgi:exosome complex RNA-binding protein Rrp42 (RNase PH superfamily)